MNYIKDKANEIDHHPEWQIKDNILRVRLTSHFNNNNLSEKDYEIAAYMSQLYDSEISLITNKKVHRYFNVILSISFVLSLLYFVLYLKNLKRRNFTSMDFVLPKVEMTTNEYFKH